MVHTTALILLAAGASRRMGKIKQLLPLNNDPAIRFCLHRILAADIGEVVVVLGNHRQKIDPFLADLPLTIVVNDRDNSEMADSAGIGREAVSDNVTGIMIHLVDQPLVLSTTYRLVADCHAHNPENIIVPTYKGRGGHPTLFPALLLREIKHSQPLNLFMHQHEQRITRLPVNDPGVVMDMDYHHEYERIATLALQER